MTKSAEAVLLEALALSDAERAELADHLLESLGVDAEPTEAPELSEVSQAEIRRRIQRVRSGEAELLEWPEVRDRVWARLRGESWLPHLRGRIGGDRRCDHLVLPPERIGG